jgi:hypothetical protein
MGGEHRPADARQGVSDVPAILDLADQLIPLGPDREAARTLGVTHGVRRELADRQGEIADPVWWQAEPARMVVNETPDSAQVVAVGQPGRPGRRGSHRFVRLAP